MKGAFQDIRRLTRHQKIGLKAVESCLKDNADTPIFSLFTLSCVADRAAREKAGRKTDLFPHLDSYRRLLPEGAKVFWNRNGLLSVKNPYYHGQVQIEEAAYMPGPFDAAVDMGPDHWTQVLEHRKAVEP